MELLSTIFYIISVVLAFFLVLPFINICFSLLMKEKLPVQEKPVKYDYAAIITAYRNAEIAQGLIDSLLRQQHERFHIYLVADACDLSGWTLTHEQLTVLKPEPALNLKVKSIIHAVEHFVRPHDYIAVFDADNLAHPAFFDEINRYANAGFKAIQGQRTAKNLDTTTACADAMGEFYKNYIERLVPYRIGSSSVISGSGMAVETELYKAYLASPEIEKGKHQWKKMLQEDKILQNFLLRIPVRIAYAWNAVCYDEKVGDAQAVETQRSRWLFSYFQNLPNSIGLIRRGIFRLNWNQFLFGLVTVTPPMFIMLFSALLLAAAGLWINPVISYGLTASLVIFAGTVCWTLYLSEAPGEVWQAMTALPGFIWRQLRGLFKMRNPNKNFKHTEHKKKVSIEEVMK